MTGLLVQHMTLGQYFLILAAMALCRGHEADAAMAVFMVVPADKVAHPAACGFQIGKAILRPLRAVFQGSKQRFRVGIVIAYTGSSARRGDAKVVQLAQQRH